MRPKVLIVDDEPYMHLLLGTHLQRTGYDLLKAANGREAIEMAAREKPAAVVMDVMMEEMDGLEALRQLKADDATKTIPVIMITANAHSVTRDQAQSCGAALFLTKPFSPSMLVQELQKLVPPSPTA